MKPFSRINALRPALRRWPYALPFFLASSMAFAQPAGTTPYMRQGSIAGASSCAPQCVLTFAAVPTGQRLVVTNVSAQFGPSSNSVTLESGGIFHFLPKPYATATTLNQPVTIYYIAGDTPKAHIFVSSKTDDASLVVTLAGYLAPKP